ncbi:DUF4149 domain-containing protein [Neisseria animalis]|uniref:DUF4149 domain-containing protein n=1 Tax=Neisseria animalis TaxID=492 RepID=A0A5P3MSH2_NEIAN|nr:DUF4149 domain-containing protein [Neisseria animalis]QEY24552.1 DUF4149 domain-containing protein [Neisseria animalis]ROW33130.1 DUF4149 domain-containing protein [Neisseria animalis]VEE07345.1 Uncharacterised protein [Neisseria animalis]
MQRIAAVFAAVWLGMQIMAGYVAAPVLFKTLPKLQAGAIAGELFACLAYSGLMVWLFVWWVSKRSATRADRRTALWAGVLAVLLAVNQFLVTPVIEAHKTQTENWLLSLLGGSFGVWHGVSSLIFMLCALLAAVAVWRLYAVKSYE